MSRRSYPLGTGLIRSYPAGAGLLVVITTVLGWLGCDSLSQVADRTADLLNRVPNANGTVATSNTAPWGTAVPTQFPSQIPAQNTGYQNPGYQNTGYQNPYPNNPAPANTGVVVNTPAYQPEAFISIGSFNIQVFGVDKISDPTVMSYLVDVARKFDILAIQEIRSTDDTIIPRFAQMISQFGVPYGYVVGPREGRTNSKEQYAFIYNEQKIQRLDQGMVVRHPSQLLHRDPLCVTFRCRTPDPRSGFSFTLMNIHTDPDDVPIEVNALVDILQLARQAFTYEDDFILLGDFNASPRQFGRLAQVSNLFAAIPPEMTTNTLRTKCYDNIVFDRIATSEFQGKYGVFDLASFYKLDPQQALLISDHQPVWGLFSAYENAQPGLAAQPLGFR